MIALGSGPRYTILAEGTERKSAKNLDCSGRIRGRTFVPKRSIVGVVLSAERYSELTLTLYRNSGHLGERGSVTLSEEGSAETIISPFCIAVVIRPIYIFVRFD